MTKLFIGATATLLLALAGAGWQLTSAHEELAEERQARAQVADALEQSEAGRQQARERLARERAALAEARERERALLERTAEIKRRADALAAEAEERGAEAADPWDCAVTPVPDDWVPERWQK